MKFNFNSCSCLVVVVLLVTVATIQAAPLQEQADVLRYDANVEPEGYNFHVETSDGKSHQEEGQLKNVGTENEALVVRGSYSYVDTDGQTYTVNYVADENGFQPEGAHLPKAV